MSPSIIRIQLLQPIPDQRRTQETETLSLSVYLFVKQSDTHRDSKFTRNGLFHSSPKGFHCPPWTSSGDPK